MILKMSAITAGNVLITYVLWRFLKDKKIIADGPSEEVINPECLKQVYDFDVASYIEKQLIVH